MIAYTDLSLTAQTTYAQLLDASMAADITRSIAICRNALDKRYPELNAASWLALPEIGAKVSLKIHRT